ATALAAGAKDCGCVSFCSPCDCRRNRCVIPLSRAPPKKILRGHVGWPSRTILVVAGEEVRIAEAPPCVDTKCLRFGHARSSDNNVALGSHSLVTSSFFVLTSEMV
ncbi:unnamed protein product, partial [Ectocarpus sp. 6 AP-2014]